MNLMVQNLLLTTLGTVKFIMLHKNHPLTQAIQEFKLIDSDHLANFIETIRSATQGKSLVLSMEDEILIYTAMDLTCKAYLTDLGDQMQSINAAKLESTQTSFSEIRSTILKGCEIVMEGMREALSDDPKFGDRLDILENYVLV